MDREVCVLIYSEYSQASQRIMNFIQNLPYDIAAVTGMSLLAADTQEIRDKLSKLNILSVPCIFIRYFNGTTAVYNDELVYSFIDAITRSVSDVNVQNVLDSAVENITVQPQEKQLVIHDKDKVMAAAAAIQKSRESADSDKKQVPGDIVQRIQPGASTASSTASSTDENNSKKKKRTHLS